MKSSLFVIAASIVAGVAASGDGGISNDDKCNWLCRNNHGKCDGKASCVKGCLQCLDAHKPFAPDKACPQCHDLPPGCDECTDCMACKQCVAGDVNGASACELGCVSECLSEDFCKSCN